jgi:hypothetical protein
MIKTIAHIIRASLIGSCLLPGFTGLEAAAPAQTFSADLVVTRADGKPNGRPGRVYVSSGKVRIEAPDFADGFFIVDGDSRAALFVRPRQRLFMDAKQSSPLTQLLVPVDPHDPCRQWQVMETVAGVIDGAGDRRCESVGQDVIDGHETMKYLVISGHGHRSYRWIDPQREFPIRVETGDGTVVALENIVVAPQSSSLFAIPPDFHKFDPAQLIEQVKQSDVWVEPPRE